MRCIRCATELHEGELICPRCGYLSVEDRSGTVSLNINRPASKRTKSLEIADNPLGAGIVLHIRGLQKRLSLAELGDLVVGRSDPINGIYPDLDLAPYGAEQRGVSRHHVRLRYADGELTITDLNSANGTQINGEKIKPHQPRPLKDGDELILGQLAVGIRFMRDTVS
jgi:pSer/pThr/pTyr-binding forkhead associated (FHA) protein